ncbi:MAG: hypothetical protein R3C56_01340 [Pirellulaceae bacterium]
MKLSRDYTACRMANCLWWPTAWGHQAGNRAAVLAIDLLINQLLNSMHWFLQMDMPQEEPRAGLHRRPQANVTAGSRGD